MGSEDFTFHDLRVVVEWLPTDSALYRAREPEKTGWTLDTYFLAKALDGVRWLQWSKSEQAEKNTGHPVPVSTPWDEPDKKPVEGADLDDTFAWLEAKNGKRVADAIR